MSSNSVSLSSRLIGSIFTGLVCGSTCYLCSYFYPEITAEFSIGLGAGNAFCFFVTSRFIKSSFNR